MRNLPISPPFYKISILWSLKKFFGMSELNRQDVCAIIEDFLVHGKL